MKAARNKAREKAITKSQKVALYEIMAMAADLEHYMLENFGMLATPNEDLPDGQPSEEYLIELRGEKKK